MDSNKKIVMLLGKDHSSYAMYNALKKSFPIDKVILEDPPEIKNFIKRRIRRLGLFTVFGQLIFQVTVPRLQRRFSKERINKIIADYGLDFMGFDPDKLIKVSSVNSPECLKTLNELAPDLVIVNGTRIISKNILNSVNATFINTHTGITPKYRGVHGAYWALVNNDALNCGVTVHLVDPGIDTGDVLKQKVIHPISEDNFLTYTYLQLGEGIRLLNDVVQDFLEGKLTTQSSSAESKLYTHPTIGEYLSYRLLKGVK